MQGRLGQSWAVLGRAEALLRFRGAAGLGGAERWAPGSRAPGLIHVHLQSVTLPSCTLQKGNVDERD